MKITQRQIKNSVGNSEPDDMLMVLEAFVRDLKKRDNSKTTSTQLQQQLGQAIKDLERTNNIVKRMHEDNPAADDREPGEEHATRTVK